MERKPENVEKDQGLNIEKPPLVYHGSSVEIAELEPRERFTPAEGVGNRVYASDLPAFAAAHSFPWHSGEGVELDVDEGTAILRVPTRLKERLMVPVFIYTMPSESFNWVPEESTGHTLGTSMSVRPTNVERFNTVEDAITHFGGQVIYKDESEA